MDNELYHHGVKGMKWGIRRYQNDDGSLTKAGEKRYTKVDTVSSKKTGDQFYIAQKRNRNEKDRNRAYDIINNGKKIGDLYLEHEGDNLYLNWVSIKKQSAEKGMLIR